MNDGVAEPDTWFLVQSIFHFRVFKWLKASAIILQFRIGKIHTHFVQPKTNRKTRQSHAFCGCRHQNINLPTKIGSSNEKLAVKVIATTGTIYPEQAVSEVCHNSGVLLILWSHRSLKTASKWDDDFRNYYITNILGFHLFLGNIYISDLHFNFSVTQYGYRGQYYFIWTPQLS